MGGGGAWLIFSDTYGRPVVAEPTWVSRTIDYPLLRWGAGVLRYLHVETSQACAGLARVWETADHTRGELTIRKTITLEMTAER